MARYITAWGKTKTIRQWSMDDRCKVCCDTLRARLNKGWGFRRAMETPPQRAGRKPSRPKASNVNIVEQVMENVKLDHR